MSEQFYFCIPFKPKARSNDWALTEALLAETLRSIFFQTDPDFQVLIAGHDRPNIPELEDPRVTFMVADCPIPQDGEQGKTDQIRKMHILGGVVGQRGGGYVMVVDSDDLVDKRIRAFVRENPHSAGYMIRAGYIYDTAANLLGLFPHATRVNQLWAHCGTCAIFRFSPEDLPKLDQNRLDIVRGKSVFQRLKGHRRWESQMMALGRFMGTLPFRGVIYRMNTGNNASYEYRRNQTFIDDLLAITRTHPSDIGIKTEYFGV